jgi:YVTN family beta-propeller protein
VKLHVVNRRSGSVSVIGATDNRKLKDVSVGEFPWGVVIH